MKPSGHTLVQPINISQMPQFGAASCPITLKGLGYQLACESGALRVRSKRVCGNREMMVPDDEEGGDSENFACGCLLRCKGEWGPQSEKKKIHS